MINAVEAKLLQGSAAQGPIEKNRGETAFSEVFDAAENAARKTAEKVERRPGKRDGVRIRKRDRGEKSAHDQEGAFENGVERAPRRMTAEAPLDRDLTAVISALMMPSLAAMPPASTEDGVWEDLPSMSLSITGALAEAPLETVTADMEAAAPLMMTAESGEMKALETTTKMSLAEFGREVDKVAEEEFNAPRLEFLAALGRDVDYDLEGAEGMLDKTAEYADEFMLGDIESADFTLAPEAAAEDSDVLTGAKMEAISLSLLNEGAPMEYDAGETDRLLVRDAVYRDALDEPDGDSVNETTARGVDDDGERMTRVPIVERGAGTAHVDEDDDLRISKKEAPPNEKIAYAKNQFVSEEHVDGAGEDAFAERNIEYIAEKIVENADIERRGDLAEVRIQLKPERLDAAMLKISSENGVVTASFVVKDENIRRIIEANFSALRNALLEQGLQIADLSVSVGQDERFARDGWRGEGEREVVRIKAKEARRPRYQGPDVLQDGGAIDCSA
ncbi:MAG: flagellar hook-length control protein FliK [Clostridiales bacterium]|nr:flagellar hook-length control protein FliK [Clostridiales bacterium]